MRITFFLFILASFSLHADDGLIHIKSPFTVAKTTDRMEQVLRSQGMTIFSRIDHALGAQKAGNVLRPTELIIFGNPKIGTLLMQCNQKIAIDLPLKALVWKDEDSQVWISYSDPIYLANRHNLSDCDKPIAKISGALKAFTESAVSQ